MVQELDIPTVADCLLIGRPVPQMLVEMELALGADEVRYFISQKGGTKYKVPSTDTIRDPKPGAVNEWLRDYMFGPGDIDVPKFPLDRTSRLRWTIYQRLLEGQSLTSIALAVDCNVRTVSSFKRHMAKSNQLNKFASASKDTPT